MDGEKNHGEIMDVQNCDKIRCSPSKDEIVELKAYVEGVLHGKVIMEQMGYCKRCGKYDDLRFGLCFDCVFPFCPLDKCDKKRIEKTGIYDYRYKNLKGNFHCTRNEGFCFLAELKLKMEKR